MPAANAKGDATATGKLPEDASPVVGHAACLAGSGAHDDGEECRFLWQYMADPTTGTPSTSPYNDTLGVCFEFAKFKYDPTGGSNATVIEPSCTTLKAGSDAAITGPRNVVCNLGDGQGGSAADCYAVFHGCYKLADSMFASNKHAEVVAPKQLAGRFHAYLGDAAKLRRVGGIR